MGLTHFVSLVTESEYFDLLNATGDPLREYTIFAPTDKAFEEAGDLDADLNVVVGNHIYDGTVKESDLHFNRRFNTLANTTIHSTTVVFGDHYAFQSGLVQYGYGNMVRYSYVSNSINYSWSVEAEPFMS